MIYCFDIYELDTQRRELRRAGLQVAIEPKVFDVLVYLAGVHPLGRCRTLAK